MLTSHRFSHDGLVPAFHVLFPSRGIVRIVNLYPTTTGSIPTTAWRTKDISIIELLRHYGVYYYTPYHKVFH